MLQVRKPNELRKILFWDDQPGKRPQDFVRSDVPVDARTLIVQALRNGRESACYKGWANCRICNAMLGSCDLEGYGFVWPSKAEHYLVEHNVWTPGCAALLAAIQGQHHAQ
jgi:hypothetical protein